MWQRLILTYRGVIARICTQSMPRAASRRSVVIKMSKVHQCQRLFTIAASTGQRAPMGYMPRVICGVLMRATEQPWQSKSCYVRSFYRSPIDKREHRIIEIFRPSLVLLSSLSWGTVLVHSGVAYRLRRRRRRRNPATNPETRQC